MRWYLLFGLVAGLCSCESGNKTYSDRSSEGATGSSDSDFVSLGSDEPTPPQSTGVGSDSLSDTGADSQTENQDSGASNTDIQADTEEENETDTEETGTDTDALISACPEGSTRHTTQSGRVVCCSEDYPLFCDEMDGGFEGSCFGEGVDCETVTRCDGRWLACQTGQLPFCDVDGDMSCHPCPDDAVRYETGSGRPICCTEERPLFCDENELGYTGGCWASTINCDSIIPCGDFFSACPLGWSSRCEAGEILCE